jgi:hypothetical protein
MSDQLAKLVAVLEARGAEVTIRKIREVGEEGKRTGKKLEQSNERSNKSFMALAGRLGLVAAASTAAYKSVALLGRATLVAARVETLGVVARNVGRNAGYMAGEINRSVKEIERLGITSRSAMQGLTRGVQSGLSPDDVAKLARAAQDAAVVMGTDSSAGLDRLIHGITTAQIEVLRTIGILVNFESEYNRAASAIDKTASSLTEQEKIQIRVNAVLREAEKLQGNYEESMQTAAKQLGSLSREWETFLQTVGERTQSTFFGAVKNIRAAVTAATEFLEVTNADLRAKAERDMARANRTEAAAAGSSEQGGSFLGGAIGFLMQGNLIGNQITKRIPGIRTAGQDRAAALRSMDELTRRNMMLEGDQEALLQASTDLNRMIMLAKSLGQDASEYESALKTVFERLDKMARDYATMASPEELSAARSLTSMTTMMGRSMNSLSGRARGAGVSTEVGKVMTELGAGGQFSSMMSAVEIARGSNDPATQEAANAAIEMRNKLIAQATALDRANFAERIRGQEKSLTLLQARVQSQGELTEVERTTAEIRLGSLMHLNEEQRAAVLAQAARQDALEAELKTQQELKRVAEERANNVKANDDVVAQLEQQIRLVRQTSDERAVALNLEKLNADATDEQKAAVERLAGELLRLSRRMEAARNLSQEWSNTLVEGLRRGKLEVEDFGNALLNMLSRLAANSIQENILGPLLQAGASAIPGFGGLPMMARGGITQGPSIAGEAEPEAVIPLPDGRTVPVNITGGGGAVVNVTVNMDGSVGVSGGDSGSEEQDARQFGQVIGMLVRDEIQKQQRPGGLLRG